MPLFWPWSKEFSSPLILTFGIRHKDFSALFSLENVWSCTYELLTCSAITVVVLVLWKTRMNSRFAVDGLMRRTAMLLNEHRESEAQEHKLAAQDSRLQ